MSGDYAARSTLRSDDDVYRFVFGPTGPIAGRLPHIVALAGSEMLSLVLSTLGCSGGVMFDKPPFNPDGTFFDQVLTPIEDFKLWGAPANQKAIVERASRAKLGCFTMVIDLATPLSIVEWFYESRDPDLGPHITNMLPMIVERIEDLRWAYFPIEEEFPLAMFVVRPAEAGLIDAVEAAAKGERLPCTRIVEERGRFTWHLPAAMRAACHLFW